jgi:RHS repeat-associated protein
MMSAEHENKAGWPVSSDTFYPYGQEQNPTADPNHYKFTGLERDQESGLDHATFRQLSSTQGRWMSPDPYDGSMNLNYPQTLNRYAYVGNNPLGYTDPTGLDGNPISVAGGLGGCIGAAASGGGDIADDISCGITLAFDIAGLFSHPKFTGATRARPNAHIWDEKQFPIHYGPNIGGALGLPSSGCEFGACGFAPGNGNSTIATLALPSIGFYNLLSLIHFPYHDASDPNHRLFGTHYCGPGGGGDTTGGVDQLCAAHDACYKRMGMTGLNTINPFSSGAAMGGCDRLLCASLQAYQPTSSKEGSQKSYVQQAFGCSYILKE